MNINSSCVLSVDVEDWFHLLDLPSVPSLGSWGQLPSHIEKNFLVLLDLFDEFDTKVTCFILGWVAENHPHLVREAEKRGHEIASHSYAHRLVHQQTQKEFFNDACQSKKIIEDIIGKQIRGFRAAGFSVTQETPWFHESLADAGYEYSSSIFPKKRQYGGIATDKLSPFVVPNLPSHFVECPITVSKVFGKRFCFFGGGYLRLFPYTIIKSMTKQVLSQGRMANFYIHPREIDVNHPKLKMNLKRKFQSYVGLKTVKNKLQKLMTHFRPISFEQYLQQEKLMAPQSSEAPRLNKAA